MNLRPGVDGDWTFEDAVAAGVVAADEGRPAVGPAPARLADPRPGQHRCLRRPSRRPPACCTGTTGRRACWPPASGPPPRFIWMANKETDRITSYPTTFIESAGTQTKRALRIARRYGCVLESTLPMSGRLSPLSTAAFYTRAAKYRIASYHNLRRNRAAWRRWLCHQGPILARVVVDRTWDRATRTRGELEQYRRDTARGGHAVCLGGLHRGRLHRAQQLGHGPGATAASPTPPTTTPRTPSPRRTAQFCSTVTVPGHPAQAAVAVDHPWLPECLTGRELLQRLPPWYAGFAWRNRSWQARCSLLPRLTTPVPTARR